MPRQRRPGLLWLPQPLAGAWDRLQRALQPQKVELVYSPRYPLRLGGTPIDPSRAEKVLSFLMSEGLVGRRRPRVPQPATLKALGLVHTNDYLERLHRPGALVPIVGFAPDDELEQRALAAQRLAVGGTRLATRLALQRTGVVWNLGGGFHHARPEAGGGFCIFNDVAVAIRAHRQRGFEGAVLVVDLDLHDGDGTRAAFADDPTVFTFSIHNRHWDDTGATASESIELSGEVGDDEYLPVLAERLPDLVDLVRPELVYFLAGTDPAADDSLGNWRLSAEGMLRRDRLVFETLEERLGDVPTVVVLAGGYGRRTWRYTARTLAWLLSGEPIEPPSEEATLVARYRRIFAHLEPGELSTTRSDIGDDVWDLSEDDIFADLMGAKRSTRLLGHFSSHGIELVLERCGLLDRLRDAGFPRPHLELDLDSQSGETVRIYGDGSRIELLIEVRLRRDTRTVPGFDLLCLEWLLMQNPRVRFGSARQPLPGQNHPGLGLLNDMMALLIMICEQLGLDGISFVPSHYHLAAKGKKFLRFLDPADEAWFRAVHRAVRELPLASATAAVGSGRVTDKDGVAIAWRPMLMVLAVSDRLRERIDSEEYEAATQRALSGLGFRLDGEV